MKTITSFARDKRWVGLIFALVSVVLLSMIMTVFYEIVIPRARNVKGIEQSNVAAYNAESGIEASLNSFTGLDIVSLINQSGTWYSSSGILSYNCPGVVGNTCTFPESWKGNSPTSSDYNIIRPGSPIQIPIANWTITPGFSIIFHMPTAFSGGLSSRALKDDTKPYFIWTFTTNPVTPWTAKSITSWVWEKLIFTNPTQYFTINNSTSTWITNAWAINQTLWNFIIANQNDCDTDYKCTLKISLIQDLETDDGKKIPYLEYKISSTTGNALKIPLQYSTITSTGSQWPFSKTVTREVERFTTNEAFDFTVLQ